MVGIGDREPGRAASHPGASDAGGAAARRGDHAAHQLRRPGRRRRSSTRACPTASASTRAPPTGSRSSRTTSSRTGTAIPRGRASRTSPSTRRATWCRRATRSTGPSGTNTSARRRWTMIDGMPWYFTGRGVVRVAERRHVDRHQRADGQGGEDPAVRLAEPRERRAAPRDGSRGDVYLSEDSFRLRSQAYAYFADDFPGAIHGDGAFAVWVPDDQGDGDPSTNDIAKGETLSGRFVTDPARRRYSGLAAERAGGGARLVQLHPHRGRRHRPGQPRRRVLRGHRSEQGGDEARTHLPDDVRSRATRARRRSRSCSTAMRATTS